MNRMLLVAWREFASVVLTKGFLLGVLMTPVMIGISVGAVILMKNQPGPQIAGRLILVDKTGAVAPGVVQAYSPDAVTAEQRAQAEKVSRKIEETASKFNLPEEQTQQAKSMAGAQVVAALGGSAKISVEVAGPDFNLDAAKAMLADTRIVAKGDTGDSNPLLAIVVIPADALKPAADGKFGQFDLFVAPKLDFQISNTMERRVGDALVDARVAAEPRITSSGISVAEIRSLLTPPNIKAVTVTKDGDKKSMGELQTLIPMAFMLLMMIGTMTTGQYLMTTVVEEKSSRVIEVLLSAVSPMQLMAGKILGHLCVGVLIIGVYGGLGMTGLILAALTQLVSPSMLALMVVYFIIAAVTMAALMAAIGSAVNEMREAQTLMTPVMMLVMLPWLMWFFIQRAPNSTFATVLSFLPGVNPFVMVLRMGGSEPIPAWQHPVAIVIGAATCLFSLWAAAKIFRIGVLMYGKPPNFATLVKWVRMA